MDILFGMFALLVSVVLFIVHRIVEWKFEREKFLRGKLEELSFRFHDVAELCSFPSNDDHEGKMVSELDLFVACGNRITRINSEFSKAETLVHLHFLELRDLTHVLRKEIREFSEVLIEWPESKNSKPITENSLNVSRVVGEIHRYIVSNQSELTGNILGR